MNKMKKDTFMSVMSCCRRTRDRWKQLSEQGIDANSLLSPMFDCITNLFRDQLSERVFNMVQWYMWCNDYGRAGRQATDAKGNPICYNDESLWEYIEKYNEYNEK